MISPSGVGKVFPKAIKLSFCLFSWGRGASSSGSTERLMGLDIGKKSDQMGIGADRLGKMKRTPGLIKPKRILFCNLRKHL